MKFNEMKPGMVIKSGPVTVDETVMLEFARQYDPQWFHVDAQRAQGGRWAGLIASGWLTCALAMRMATDSVLSDSESFGSPGLEKLRWMHPVRAADQLRLESTIDTVRTSSSRSDLGIVRWTWRVYNQNDQQVLETEVTSLFDLAAQGGETGNA
jgi:acyl dehydratase